MKNRKVLKFLVFGFLSLVIVVFLGQQVYAQNNIPSINGQWTYLAKVFHSDGQSCLVGNNDREQESTVTIIQRGNQFTSSGGISYSGGRGPAFTDAIGEGTIVNNQIQSRSGPNIANILLSWSGAISSDGNIISGNLTCMYRGRGRLDEGNIGFTLTRVSGLNQNQTNSPSVAPQPNPNPRGLRPL